MGIKLRMGVGYGLLPMPQVLAFVPEVRVCCWGGACGSLVIADVDRRLTFAYVMATKAGRHLQPMHVARSLDSV